MQVKEGLKVFIEKDKCKGCQLCAYYCPVKHLKVSQQLNKKGRNFVEPVESAVCIGCGICFSMCPDAAIRIGVDNIHQTTDTGEIKEKV